MTDAKRRIDEIEAEMQNPDFWNNKGRAQELIKELGALKEEGKRANRYDSGDAVLAVMAGAGGDDAEDWARVLYDMYVKYAERRTWNVATLHEHRNERGGIKNISVEVRGDEAYGTLKNESGVHRLVRISPFSSKKLRHTSFALVEVIPKLVRPDEVIINEDEIRVEFARSGGPGGQNVNKRETAVRVVHLPTNVAVHVDSERSQQQNKERALELLKSKLYTRKLESVAAEEASMKIGDTPNEWGHQIRSYVLHPYKLVKDHRTDVETSDVDGVLVGDLDEFIDAERTLNPNG